MSIAPHAVLCFFQDVIADVVERHAGRVVDHLASEIGRNPIYEIDLDGRRLVVVHPGVGAPLAAGFLEELIARGCRSFVACGGAGVLVPDVALGHVIVPTSAVRDEGTSYHYLPASRTAEPSPAAVEAIVAAASAARRAARDRRDVDHRRATTARPATSSRPASRRAASRSRWRRRRSSPSPRSAASRWARSCTRATTSPARPGTAAGGTSTRADARRCSASPPRPC